MRLLVVANRIGAEIFKIMSQDELQLIKTMENPLGREKNKAMTTGKPGVSRGKYKKGTPHNLTGGKDPHEEAADQFVLKLTAYLKKEVAKDHTIELHIVAGPRMLGKIKSHLVSPNTKKVKWTAKNVEKVPQEKWPRLIGLKEKKRSGFTKPK